MLIENNYDILEPLYIWDEETQMVKEYRVGKIIVDSDFDVSYMLELKNFNHYVELPYVISEELVDVLFEQSNERALINKSYLDSDERKHLKKLLTYSDLNKILSLKECSLLDDEDYNIVCCFFDVANNKFISLINGLNILKDKRYSVDLSDVNTDSIDTVESIVSKFIQ